MRRSASRSSLPTVARPPSSRSRRRRRHATSLRASTIDGARFLGHDDEYGTLDAGKVADVVLLDADPLRDIAATQKIHTVVQKGQVHDRADLDGMLADVARRVAVQQEAVRSAKP